jgi:mono/diheme cytochrome c family protein
VFLFLAIAIPGTVSPQRSAPQAAADGKRIFNQSCLACHDTLGTATKPGAKLKNYYRRQPRPTDATVSSIIRQGKGKMPAFSTLNKTQVDDLVAYIKTL